MLEMPWMGPHPLVPVRTPMGQARNVMQRGARVRRALHAGRVSAASAAQGDADAGSDSDDGADSDATEPVAGSDGAGDGDAADSDGATAGSAAVSAADAGSSSGAATSPGDAAPADAEDLSALTPREAVSKLDSWIIGQDEAKRAVAIALRNRWRRLQLSPELQSEVMPKNILMVGPTGCGKTEIARRLANMCAAPFIKVEATRFTEVGFHGRDVDLIIRDLVEVSVNLTRKQKMEKLKDDVAAAAEQRILEILTGPEARADTVESFRRLLRSGELDERTIEVELPADGGGAGGPFAVELGGGPGGQAVFGDFLGKVISGKGAGMASMLGGMGKRLEKQRVTIAEAMPLVREMEMEARLGGIDILKESIRNAEQNGIVFIDEIDKIVTSSRDYRGADASSEGVQRDLLPLVEGCIVNTKHGNVNTNHVLFICSGAFHTVKPSDLLAELQGRLPIRVELAALTEADLRRILVEPEANLVRQQVALIGAEGVTLTFTEGALDAIARLASQMNRLVENIGARRLFTVMERLCEGVSFDASELEDGSEFVVDEAMVTDLLAPMLKKSDLSKFIL